MKPLPAWALAEADALIDVIRSGPRHACRDLLAGALALAQMRGTVEATNDACRIVRETVHARSVA